MMKYFNTNGEHKTNEESFNLCDSYDFIVDEQNPDPIITLSTENCIWILSAQCAGVPTNVQWDTKRADMPTNVW
ncbi:hypothetical protein CEXT_51641 [Caerostris extrusa]|uniref:Uncharacterized protein n=1 Tax=Caerostris extrusa TaxID=172846 RepID=A0AAV4Y563_CAEEX|nr:hypothetical protein CEXT_51641 [Caerostris extrusa]